MEIGTYLGLSLEERHRVLKRLVFDLIPEGQVKELAYAVGKSPYTLYKWRDETCETHTLIRPELLELLARTGNFALLDFLNGLFGRLSTPQPQPLVSLEDLNRHLTGVLREIAATCQTALEALATESPGGPEITGAEFEAIKDQVRGAQRQLASLEEAARRRVRGTWPGPRRGKSPLTPLC